MSESFTPGFSIADDLLHTKLAPPRLHAAVVPRTGLYTRLDEGATRSLTLVTAPAGFGKTTLLTGWLAERSTPSAWISLDNGDNEPIRFWRYVITACSAFAPELGRSTL